jgi:hypothetical protein
MYFYRIIGRSARLTGDIYRPYRTLPETTMAPYTGGVCEGRGSGEAGTCIAFESIAAFLGNEWDIGS